jgi:hypothetical protein
MGKKKKRQATCEQASASTRRKDKWQKNGKKNIRVQEAGAKHPLPVTSNEVEYPGIEPRS